MARINRKTAPEGLADPFASTHGLRIIVKSYAQVKGLYGLSTSETVAFFSVNAFFLNQAPMPGDSRLVPLPRAKLARQRLGTGPSRALRLACAEPARPEPAEGSKG